MATTLRSSGIQMGSSVMDVGGSAPSYPARAWVNFNGVGTIAIRASGNVSSLTDNGTGNYRLNFSTALPDTNYSLAGSTDRVASASGPCVVNINDGGLATSSVTIAIRSTARIDEGTVCVAIFR